jgi:multiple sugar transport system ATP-binding protein
MASVRFSGVGKVFPDGTRALKDFDLEAQDGEFMVFVGPSGCGKTTALRLVAGLEDVTEGEIAIGDTVINDVDPQRRDVAMVFQNYALYPHMTVRANMGFGLRMRKVRKNAIEAKVADIARILGIHDLLERKPGQLSGGQRQRVAMGRAIVREPQAFLMDEPLSNLDAKLRVQMRAEVSRIQKDLGVTTIYVTHDQVEALTMGDRIAVMRKGELQQVDGPEAVYESPVNLFVATFIGSPAMNLVETRLEQQGDRLVCAIGSQKLQVDSEQERARFDLARASGRRLALGIRPEALEDAAIAGDGAQTLDGLVVLTEPLGSERLAHIELDAVPVVTDEVAEAAEDAAEVLREGLEDSRRTVVVGRFDAGSRVSAGERVTFAVDTKKLHLFDLESGLALR